MLDAKSVIWGVLSQLWRESKKILGENQDISLRMQVKGVFDGDVIALRQRTKAVDTLDGAHGGEVESRGAAGGFDARV